MCRTLLDVSGFCVGRGRLQLKKSCVRISCRQPYRAPPSETTFVEIQRQTGCQARSPPRSSKSGIHGRKLWPADPSRHNRQSSRSLLPEPAGRCLQREKSVTGQWRRTALSLERKTTRTVAKKVEPKSPQPASSNL